MGGRGHMQKNFALLQAHTHTLTVLGWLFRRFTLLRHFSEWRVKGESRKQNKNANNRIRDSSQQK